MKIAIVNNCVPFIRGGAEYLADSLCTKLQEYGHQAILIKIPFKWYPPQKIVEHILACRLLRFENIDKVVGLKFPAYYVNHPNKVLWLLHQHRTAYDLWGTDYQDIPSTPEGLRIRETIIQSDNLYLRQANQIYTISKVITGRLKIFNGIDSEVLYPPLMDAEQYHCADFGDYLFYPSRITMGKRQHLAVESMKYTRSTAKLIIAGNPDSPEQLEYVESIVKRNNLQNKVKIIGNWISEKDKISLFANALGCLFIPFDEDYGYVTLEACYSRKPVITCSDSGGVLELVEDGITGKIVPPEPQALAEAIDNLFNDRTMAAKMGLAGHEKPSSLNISWERVMRCLTA